MKILNIVSMLLISILIFSGCSMKNNKIEIDEATQQKNITKVQNDITEIMGKNYEDVIKNIGKPYLTTYYINSDDYKKYEKLDSDELLKQLHLEMVYPKEGYESSALYIEINKDKVIYVSSNEFVGTSHGFDDLPESSKSTDVIIDIYNNQKYISEEKLKGISIESYKGKNIEQLMQETPLDMPNAIAYGRNKDKVRNYFVVDKNQEKLSYIISITEDRGKITNISKVSKVSLINSLIDMSK
ncbi:hypothetical protein [Paraclostridium sordellii]|uniref:hypothetical protein n=1 Tax=Paraclostridium sordellii TaxID=1505 RepID=UPI0022E3A5B4|nr:hypothetical protein [Paeniclostridium sordellii]